MNKSEINGEELMFLIMKISRLLRKQNPSQKFHLLSILQTQALMLIRENKIVTMTDIAHEFSIKLSSATELIDRLVEIKLVRRERSTEDRRTVKIKLSQKGSLFLTKSIQAKSVHAQNVLKLISIKDVRTLHRILRTLHSTLQNIT